MSFRGIGSDETDFDNRRYASDASFFYFRGSLGNTLDLPWGFQAYGLVQGQASAQPLVDTEEFALGGLNTVRGYLESAVLGDSAFAGRWNCGARRSCGGHRRATNGGSLGSSTEAWLG